LEGIITADDLLELLSDELLSLSHLVKREIEREKEYT
jgi:hypothetical protein